MISEQRLAKLVADTKRVGRFFGSAVMNSSNYPEIMQLPPINGRAGLVVACDRNTREMFLYHESQRERIS